MNISLRQQRTHPHKPVSLAQHTFSTQKKKTACEQAVLHETPARPNYQPISLNSSIVKSVGAVTEWLMSALIDGSISWLRVAVVL